ncbi:MAG: hypothetical protein Q4G33_04665, partial [bacterium]|nr:hypothetical protein [bacterium]
MKTRKFLSIFVALSLILAYMLPFAGAAELFENSVTWTFTDVQEGVKLTNSSGKEKEWYINTTDLGNGLIAYAESSIDANKNEYNRGFEIDRTSKTSFGDEEITGALKFGGKSTSTARYLTYTPAADGILTAYVKHGSPSKDNTDIRSLTVEQDGIVVGTVATVGTDNPNLKENINVKGGIEITIACDNNVALAKLVFTPGGSSEDPVTPSDTEAPSDTTEPSNTTVPMDISAWYAKASDGEPIEPDSKNNTAKIPAGKNLAEGTDIAVYAMEDLLYKDVEASFIDTNGNALTTSAEMAGRLTKSLTNPSRKDFGKSGASMKVVPSKNGTLSAYAKVSASVTKLLYINDADGNIAADYTNDSGESVYVRVDAAVEAGKEYYIYTDGAGTDFFGFEFTPSAVPSN